MHGVRSLFAVIERIIVLPGIADRTRQRTKQQAAHYAYADRHVRVD